MILPDFPVGTIIAMGEQYSSETGMIDISIAHYEDNTVENNINGVPAA